MKSTGKAKQLEQPAAPAQPSRKQRRKQRIHTEPGQPGADNEPDAFQQIFEANPELRRAWQAEREYREVFPSVEKAREAGAQLADLAQMDALFFSGRPESHAELAAAVCRLDPQSFRGLAQAMAEALAKMAPESGAQPGRETGMFRPAKACAQTEAAPQGPPPRARKRGGSAPPKAAWTSAAGRGIRWGGAIFRRATLTTPSSPHLPSGLQTGKLSDGPSVSARAFDPSGLARMISVPPPAAAVYRIDLPSPHPAGPARKPEPS
jgi:hypothetical protein